MNCVGKIAVCLAGGLVLTTSLRADDVVLPGNPYAPIVVRNVFGLNPPTPVDPNAALDATPPPKITVNGIMSIFGQLQALFKVASPAKAGKPVADDSYILSEGQRQDDIEVVKIDEKAALVTFNNHGQEQTLALETAKSGSTPAPATPGGAPPVNRFAPAGRPPLGNNGFNNTFGNRGGSPGRGGSGNPGDGSGSPGLPAQNNTIQQPQTGLTTEESIVAMEVNRELTKQQVIEGTMPPIPPTPLTPSDATSVGGAPLVAPVEPSSPP